MPLQYSFIARVLHWTTLLFIVCSIILGYWMTNRSGAQIWDDLTNTLYGWHKLIGFTILLITVLRWGVKLKSKSVPYPVVMPPRLMIIARLVQIALYGLLIVVPMLGWAGVSAYPALITVGGYHLPAMPFVPKDQALAKQIFEIHGYCALAFIALITLHMTAALRHLIVLKDGIFNRIWFRF